MRLSTFLASVLLPVSTLASAIEDETPSDHHHSKHCKLVSTVTYHDSWGPLFIEDDYECDLPPLTRPAPVTTNPLDLSPIPHLLQSQSDPNSQTPLANLPSQKHQIVSYGCVPLLPMRVLDHTLFSELLYSLPQLTNQSCILPGHLKQYREYPRAWGANWAFTNYNRGEELICDWYSELGQVLTALHLYGVNSLEWPVVDGNSVEALVYGRDRERVGQVWCLRYQKRGWGVQAFEMKCLGEEWDEGETEQEGEKRRGGRERGKGRWPKKIWGWIRKW